MNRYDSAADAVQKAIKGLGKSIPEVAKEAGLDPTELTELLCRDHIGDWATPLAKALHLDANALLKLRLPTKAFNLPQGVRQFVLPFEEDTVNVWLLEHETGSILIDAGFEPSDFRAALGDLRNFDLLITHPHRDHIGALSIATSASVNAFAPLDLPGCDRIEAGHEMNLGAWHVEAHDLRGHHPQTLGYRIKGHGLDLMVMGDALYAGSIGGCCSHETFLLAKLTLMDLWPDLDPDTIILPGHGPATTVEQESKDNPFITAWLAE